MKKFLMCEPKFFDVNYEINPWMKSQIHRVNTSLAQQQWLKLHDILSKLNCDIYSINNQEKNVPDLVFTANAGFVINNHVLLSRFESIERRYESEIFAQEFNKLNYHVDFSCLEQDVSFEGAGDILFHAKSSTYILAHGFRSKKNALNIVNNFCNKHNKKSSVLQVELVDDRFYHLDTCFCPLDNGYILYYPKAFSEQSQNILNKKLKPYLLDVSEEDAITFSCNAISVKQFLIANKFSHELTKKLLSLGLILIETPLNEFIKSGGSAKCLTLEI